MSILYFEICSMRAPRNLRTVPLRKDGTKMYWVRISFREPGVLEKRAWIL